MSLEEIIKNINVSYIKENQDVKKNINLDYSEVKKVNENKKNQSNYPKLLEFWLQKVPKSNLILDLGCSLGFTTMWLNSHSGMTIGIDNEPIMIKQAKEIHNYEHFYVDELNRLNFKENNFDSVFCYDSIKKSNNIRNTLSEIYRVCKGSLFLIMPLYGLGLKEEIQIYPFQPSTKQELEDLVRSSGFRIDESEQIDILEKTGALIPQSENQLVYIRGSK